MIPALLRIAGAARAILLPWVTFAVRIWLAQAFLAQQLGMIMGGEADARLSAPLGAGWWSALSMQVAHSGPGATVQALCPLLLVAGLLSRPAALAMLAEAVLVPLPHAADVLRPFWIALLGWLVICGPGALALDRLLGRGLRRSALPGAAPLAAAYEWATRRLSPIALLALRAWLAAAPAALVLPVMAPVHPFLPHVPSMVAHLPAWLGLLLAFSLAAGLAVSPVSLFLFALVPLGQVMSISDDRLYWLLALAILIASGGGPLSLDRVLAAMLGRMKLAPDLDSLPHVVIVGAGFGGIAAAHALKGAPCRVTLVDQRNFTLFQPLLYQVATAGLSPAEIATPIRALFRHQPNVRVVLARVTGADTARRSLHLEQSEIGYDTLVLATGAQHSYFGHDEWAALAPGLKSIEDATAIRHRLLQAFEAAETCENPAERDAWLTFVVVGGGPTGVEMAGAMAELAHSGLDGEFRRIDPARARVILIQSAPKLLPAFPPRLSDYAARRLEALGVEVWLDRKLGNVLPTHAVVDGEIVPSRTVIWAAGVMASDAAAWVCGKADRAGRLQADPDLGAPGLPNVFVIGDTAASTAWGGKPVPGLAPAAKQGGAYVARVIRRRLAGRTPPPPFRYRHFGSLATIGRQAAVAEFGSVLLTGALAWWLWGGAHIAFLIGGRSRIAVLVQWFWAYVTFRRGTRLITGGTLPPQIFPINQAASAP